MRARAAGKSKHEEVIHGFLGLQRSLQTISSDFTNEIVEASTCAAQTGTSVVSFAGAPIVAGAGPGAVTIISGFEF